VAGINLGGDADDPEPVAVEGLLDLGIGEIAAEKRVIEIDDRQVAHLSGQVDGLDDAARRAIAVGGIAVDIGGKVPDAGAETRCAHGNPPLLDDVPGPPAKVCATAICQRWRSAARAASGISGEKV